MKKSNRRCFLKNVIAGTAAVSALPAGLPLSAAGRKKPNILFFLIDDLGCRDLGFAGSDFYETPRIDALSKEGMVFTNAYANAPNCAPTRACLMSGQYTPRHGIYTVLSSARGKSQDRKIIPIENNTILPSSIVTLGETLHAAGYTTASMGKWHLGDQKNGGTGPKGQGFDVNIGGNHAGHPPGGYFSPYKNADLPDGPIGENLTDRLTREALGFIETNRDKAFFLYLPYYAVHTPIQGKKDLIEKYKKKLEENEKAGIETRHKNPGYAAMVETVDTGIGKILDKLDELKIADDTLVVFFSDNGGVGGITTMAPLRGSKGMLYEGGIREPMIVRWPGKVRPASRCDTPVIGIDFYPTLTEIAGGKKPKGQPLDGVSILPLLRQTGEIAPRPLFWHFPAYLQGKAPGSRDKIFRTRPAGAVRVGDWKLIEYFEDHDLELYNLKDDIGESKNLAQSNPKKAKELHRVMLEWRKKVKAPVPTEKNPEYIAPNA